MPDTPPDSPPDSPETPIAEFRPDPGKYWSSHGVMALVGGVAAGLILMAAGNPDPWVGPVAAVLAIGIRAFYLRSEVLAEVWVLTDRRLTGPGGRVVPLSALKDARPFLGAVVLVSRAGDKHQIKYQADPAAVRARILAVQSGRRA